jgi:citrate synthase
LHAEGTATWRRERGGDANAGGIGSPEKVSGFLEDTFARKDKVMGFGHRVYKEGDPRAKWLKRLSKQLGEERGDTKWFDMSSEIENQVGEQKGLLPNVDFYSASVYTYMDVPRSVYSDFRDQPRLRMDSSHSRTVWG